jgi:hypothetical protein
MWAWFLTELFPLSFLTKLAGSDRIKTMNCFTLTGGVNYEEKIAEKFACFDGVRIYVVRCFGVR